MAMGGGADESAGEDDTQPRPSLSRLAEEVRARRSGDSASGEGSSAAAPDVGDALADASAFEAPPGDVGFEDLADDVFGSDPKTEAILEVIGDAASVLLLGPLLSPYDYDLCTKLSTGMGSTPGNLMLVTLTESPDERLNVFQAHLDHLPERTYILNVGDTTRSGSRETVSTAGEGSIVTETIADPTDLMRIGISISKRLSKWEDEPGHTTLCFHSLTALLQYAEDPRVVFRFAHILLGRLKSTGATAHFHMDAGAHDETLVETFRPIFDEVLTFDEAGSVSVDH